MKNSAIIFVFLGLVFVIIILYVFVYIPKIDRESGINAGGFSLSLPVDHIDMRFDNGGVEAFCKEKKNDITIETRNNAVVLSPVNGAVTGIDMEKKEITIQPLNGVLVYIYPVGRVRVSVGDYISLGDVLGNVEGSSVSIVLNNQGDKTYECPYLYMDSDSQKYLEDGLKETVESSGRICECSNIKY